MQTWKISVQDTVAVLKKKPFKERFDYVREKHLCINCLMPHHMAIDCVSKARCLKCKKKHHYLLHSNSYGESKKQGTKEGPKQTKQNTKVKMVSSGVAGSGLEGFPKQWWPKATGSPKGRAFLGGSGGMLPRKILQTEVSEIAILTTFQLQTTHKFLRFSWIFISKHGDVMM